MENWMEKAPPIIGQNGLKELSNHKDRLIQLRNDIKEKEEEVKQLKELERKISREELPECLLRYGISSIDLDTGERVTIKTDVACSIPKTDMEKRKAALRWLKDHDGLYLIKDSVVVPDPEKWVLDELKNKQADFTRVVDVNTASLKAFFRGKLGLKKNSVQTLEVQDIPKELNLYVYKQTIIK